LGSPTAGTKKKDGNKSKEKRKKRGNVRVPTSKRGPRGHKDPMGAKVPRPKSQNVLAPGEKKYRKKTIVTLRGPQKCPHPPGGEGKTRGDGKKLREKRNRKKSPAKANQPRRDIGSTRKKDWDRLFH